MGFRDEKQLNTKKCVIRIAAIDLRKGSKNTPLSKHQDLPHLAPEPFITIRSLRTLFFGAQNAWNHVPNVSLAVRTPDVTSSKFYFSAVQMAGIIRSKFFGSRSNGWQRPFRNFSFTLPTARVIRLNFFLCRSNGSRHPFEISSVPLERLHPFEFFPVAVGTAGTSVSHPFVILSQAVRLHRLTDICQLRIRVRGQI